MSQRGWEEDEPDYCVCGAEMEWEVCDRCAGDGYVEHEPDNEEPWLGVETCEDCYGEGVWHLCSRIGTPEHTAAIEQRKGAAS